MSISDILLGDQDDKERLNKGSDSGQSPGQQGQVLKDQDSSRVVARGIPGSASAPEKELV